MSDEYVLELDDVRATLETTGGKGASLARLARAGLPVPGGFHLTTAAYRQFVDQNHLQAPIRAALEEVDPARPSTLEDAAQRIGRAFAGAELPAAIATALEAAYRNMGDDPAVAVRSSATAEDLPDLSFAGQQETYLNVRGLPDLYVAVKRCWASLWTGRAIGYRLRHGLDQETVRLAVVVQHMAQAQSAGIMFTANPLDGSRREVVINAAWGLGEAVVGGLVSPDTVVADKETGRVLRLEVGDKATMVVPGSSGTAEQAVDLSRRRTQVLDDVQVAELVRLGRRIEAEYGVPQDIEWCWADGRFFITQARPITALDRIPIAAPAVDVPPPGEWQVPDRRARYMRNNIVELIPDPLTPLFGTLGRRVINACMRRALADFLGKPDLMPQEPIISIQGYAYYNGEFTPGQIAWILIHSVGIMRRMFTGAVERWREGRARYREAVRAAQSRPWSGGSTAQILDHAAQLLEAAIDYYLACVSGLIPAAWISEGLFTVLYERLIRRKGDPAAATCLLGFDSAPIVAEKALYDLAQWVRERAGLAALVLRTPAAQLAAQRDGPAPAGADEQEWRIRLDAYLREYGATIYDLDFQKPTPADDPTPALEALKLFVSGQGGDPHARQRAAAERREQATQALLSRLRGLRLVSRSLARAQKYAPLREDGLSDIGLGYPLLRRMLLEVGRRLAQAGAIDEAGDVFWLAEDEIARCAAAIEQGQAAERLAAAVVQRQALWQARRQVVPPVTLPLPPRFLRRFLPAQVEVPAEGRAGEEPIRGIPGSPGSTVAVARVLRGPEEFDQMVPGAVLVAAITTPAWTPLFAMAAAIVTDIGGPLSHGSIVAREYGIPAVLGTGNATRRLHTGDRVRVDGSRGVVEVLERT